MTIRITVLAFLASLSVFFSVSACAWGSVGHATVAYIADDNIAPATREAVAKLLGEGETMASVASWADDYKKDHRETAGWHFIDLPIPTGASSYVESDEPTYCADSDCVVDQIDKDVEILKSDKFTDEDKTTALKFLIHFVGDVHQPLHCATDGDRGGNEKYVRFRSSSRRSPKGTLTELHAVWDDLIEVRASEDPHELATELDEATNDSQKVTWRAGTPADWAWESYQDAQQIYQAFPHGPIARADAKPLPSDYYSTDDKPSPMRKIVDTRLEQAGVRLAWLLDDIFSPPTGGPAASGM